MVLTGASRIAIELGAVTCGVSIALAASSGLACAIYRWMNHPTEVPTHELIFDVNETSTYFRDKQHKSDKKQKLSSQNNNTPSGNDKEPNERNTDKVANLLELFKRIGFGQALKKIARPTKRNFKGAKIFEAAKDLTQYGIKKGDQFYLDTLHKDHIEVFNQNGNTA